MPDVLVSELFTVMKRRQELAVHLDSGEDFPVGRIAPYMGTFVPGTLYVADAAEWGRSYALAPGSGLLLAAGPEEVSVTGGPWAARDTDRRDLIQAAFEGLLALQDWIGRIKDALLGEDALAALLPMGAALGKPYCVLDQGGSLLYVSPEMAGVFPTPVLPPDRLSLLFDDREFQALSEEAEPFRFRFPFLPETCLWLPLKSDRFSAWLLTPESPEDASDPGLRNLFSRFGGYIRRAIPKNYYRETLRRWDDPQHTLISGILFHPRKYTQADSQVILRPFGWEIDQEYTLIKLISPPGSTWEFATEYICSRLEALEVNSCAVSAPDGIAWLVNRTLAGTSMNRPLLTELVNRAVILFSCYAGISYSFKGFKMLRDAYVQAGQVLDVGLRVDPGKKYYYFRDYTLELVMHMLTKESGFSFILHPSVVSMLRYDRENNTKYYETLQCLAQAAGNVTLAAEELGIHRTSLMRRLDRICELYGSDIRTPNALFHLELSFRLLQHRYSGLSKQELLIELMHSI